MTINTIGENLSNLQKSSARSMQHWSKNGDTISKDHLQNKIYDGDSYSPLENGKLYNQLVFNPDNVDL